MPPQNAKICPYSAAQCNDKKDICDKLQSEDQSACVFKTMNRAIVCEENGMRYELKNDNHSCVKRVEVDKCYIPDNNKVKCDFAVLICNSEVCCLIELKGGNIDHACEQILHTTVHLSDVIAKCQKVYARIIPSRYPAPNIRSRPKNLLFQYCQKHNGSLLIRVKHFEEKVSQM